MQPSDGMKQEVWQEGNHYHKAREGREVVQAGSGQSLRDPGGLRGSGQSLGSVWG